MRALLALLVTALPANADPLADCLNSNAFLYPDATLTACAALPPALPAIDSARALIQVALAYDSQMDSPASDAALSRALNLGPDNPEILRALAWAYYALHDSEPALDMANRALTLAPDADAYLARCTILQFDHDFRRALPDCEQAVTLAPANATARHRAAHAHNALLDFDRAFALAEPGLTLPDATPDNFLEAASALTGLGRLPEAKTTLQQGLARFPQDTELQWALDALS